MDDSGPSARLTHVRLLVDDYAACFEFYRDVFGFEPTFGDAESGYADFDAGDATLALFDRAEMTAALEPTDGPPSRTGEDAAVDREDGAALVLAVEGVDAAHDRLSDRGAEFVAGPTDRPEWGLRTAHLRDPAGTLIELNEPLGE
ncbi:hypothetical protein BRD00_08295 [Halobacteriales archaeon QS_8_69_26]|nr:MAG: hypothetical protein BRD00_08295 [Halobacteriales archaeon QS_8_69_26]